MSAIYTICIFLFIAIIARNVYKCFKPVIDKNSQLFDEQLQSSVLDKDIDVTVVNKDNKKLEDELKKFKQEN